MPWSSTEPQRLKSARESREHTQRACASELKVLGHKGADHNSVRQWETGARQPRQKTAAVLSIYIDESPKEKVVQPAPVDPATAAFLNGITHRLTYGPPMSEHDEVARQDQMRLLGIPKD
jgi:transcriptional regulator with XRE-family HTH domain